MFQERMKACPLQTLSPKTEIMLGKSFLQGHEAGLMHPWVCLSPGFDSPAWGHQTQLGKLPFSSLAPVTQGGLAIRILHCSLVIQSLMAIRTPAEP